MAAFGLIFWLSVALIAYIYAGYPLILAVLALLRPRPREWTPATPGVTLLIAAYNEADIIASKLENALALDYPSDRLQIVVAADGSDDNTVEVVRSFSKSNVGLSYEPERRGKMAAINRAIKLAQQEVVVFSDANNLFARDALREIVAPFSEQCVGAVSGSKHLIDGGEMLGAAESLYWRYESFIREKETRLGSCTGVSGEILAIRRDLYEAPPDDIVNDDFFIALNILRKGYRLVYAPKAHSFESGSATADDESRRRRRIVAGRYQAMLVAFARLPWGQPVLLWQLVSHKFLRPLVPFLMILALAANLTALAWPASSTGNPWLFLMRPFNWILFGLQVLFYALSYVGGRLRLGGTLGKALYLPAFLVNSNLAALQGLFRFVGGGQSPAWERVHRRNVNGGRRG
jgi:cellulose synthase/poly-beta-1,6-N-acetylglucosamine synthase-like glycosyltransferase